MTKQMFSPLRFFESCRVFTGKVPSSSPKGSQGPASKLKACPAGPGAPPCLCVFLTRLSCCFPSGREKGLHCLSAHHVVVKGRDAGTRRRSGGTVAGLPMSDQR